MALAGSLAKIWIDSARKWENWQKTKASASHCQS